MLSAPPAGTAAAAGKRAEENLRPSEEVEDVKVE
jgi:hypothetical protein